MSLFEKKRSVTMLGATEVDTIKQELDSMLDIAASYDKTMYKMGLLTISLEGRMRGDLLAFMLYLSGADKNIHLQEISIVNRIFDIDLSHVDFELFRKDVGNKSFERSIPPSALILSELGKHLQTDHAPTSDEHDLSKAFCDDLVNLYALIGSALLSADGQITEMESADLIRYITMVQKAVQGPDAELPSGPAQNALESHVRLFGEAPKL